MKISIEKYALSFDKNAMGDLIRNPDKYSFRINIEDSNSKCSFILTKEEFEELKIIVDNYKI